MSNKYTNPECTCVCLFNSSPMRPLVLFIWMIAQKGHHCTGMDTETILLGKI